MADFIFFHAFPRFDPNCCGRVDGGKSRHSHEYTGSGTDAGLRSHFPDEWKACRRRMGCAKKQTVARISRGEIQQDIADERRNQSNPKIERGKDIYHCPLSIMPAKSAIRMKWLFPNVAPTTPATIPIDGA
jgi:hypothetical protein